MNAPSISFPADTSAMLVGANGMLGQTLLAACAEARLSCRAIGDSGKLDITNQSAVREAVLDVRPWVIVNAAAYTNVDGAEAESHIAHRINADGAANLAHAAREANALLVHYSTDYVFDGSGRNPYKPDHPTSPINVYGRSKLAGEAAVQQSGCEHLIFRTSWLYAAHGKNFVRTMLALFEDRSELRVVNDQHGRPTYCPDLADMTLRLLQRIAAGTIATPIRRVLHAANTGECTWHEFALAIAELSGASCDIRPCATDAFPRPAARPAYSVLDLSDLAAIIGEPRHWREALAACLEEINSTSATPSQAP